MIETMNADLYGLVITGLFGLPWAIWLLWDALKHEQD